jgi:repressor LexA
MNSRKPRNKKTRDTILRYMMTFADEQGKQPSVREIGEAAGLTSTSTTAGYLRRMVNEGLLIQSTQSRRNYFITPNAMTMLRHAG